MPDMGSNKMAEVDGMQYGDAPEVVREGPPKLNDIPDIVSELDIRHLRKGSQFYARFVHDPQGDTMFWAKSHINDLRSGRMSRHGISRNFWEADYAQRPPLAEYLGNGKFKILD